MWMSRPCEVTEKERGRELLSNHVQGILSFARGSVLLLATAATAGGLALGSFGRRKDAEEGNHCTVEGRQLRFAGTRSATVDHTSQHPTQYLSPRQRYSHILPFLEFCSRISACVRSEVARALHQLRSHLREPPSPGTAAAGLTACWAHCAVLANRERRFRGT